jgi:hypothetical protein
VIIAFLVYNAAATQIMLPLGLANLLSLPFALLVSSCLVLTLDQARQGKRI